MNAMETYQIYLTASAVLFTTGLAGVFMARHFFRRIVATKIMGAGVFLSLVSFAERDALEFADPVPHAMVITGIVVAVSAAAFALALARRIHQLTGEHDFTTDS